MKNNALAFLIVSISAVILSSCAPTKTLVDTSCPGYKNIDFDRTDIIAEGIGIMPVLGGDEKEQFRRPMGDAITKYFRLEFGESKTKSPNEVILIINNEKLTDSYTQAINDYRTTGIVPKEMIAQLGKALNSKFLLYTRLLADSEIGFTSLGTTTQTYSIDEIYVQCQVWDTNLGDIVWEGKGGIAKLPQNTDNVIEKTAEGLSKVIGNDINIGPCESKKTLIESIQQAYTNSLLAITAGSTVLSLIIMLAIL